MTEAVKWALIDLLRVLDKAHGGRLHAELGRIPVLNPRAVASEATFL